MGGGGAVLGSVAIHQQQDSAGEHSSDGSEGDSSSSSDDSEDDSEGSDGDSEDDSGGDGESFSCAVCACLVCFILFASLALAGGPMKRRQP